MENSHKADPAVLAELETALQQVRKVLHKLESADGGPDYRLWSEAKGCVLGSMIEATRLDGSFLEKCDLLSSRYDLLHKLPKGGIVAEIGTQHGQFAGHIARITQPDELHLLDITFEQFDRTEIPEGMANLHLHEGDSVAMLDSIDREFNWVYLDADHSYEAVSRDLEALDGKIIPGGVIVCNDYIPWSPLEAKMYGVPKAVHEFCKRHGWGFRYMALHPWGYHDVALMRLEEM